MISDTNDIDMEVEDAWNEEIARRIQDLDSGKAKTIPLEEVRRRVSAKRIMASKTNTVRLEIRVEFLEIASKSEILSGSLTPRP